jgi:deazaflavin-dependent oxidoreductase (nitroreductase family)
MLGYRFVYLVHRGRRTGRSRETVLEVVRYDADRSEVFVVSGWGRRSDWYRNLRAGPPIEVRIGRQRWPLPRIRWLDPAETVRLLDGYSRAHPRAWRLLAPLIGLPADLDPVSADEIPAAAFRPAERR